jgi:catechol 2,3-dioxygenase-like lactoylglutathione lyase family enzyme
MAEMPFKRIDTVFLPVQNLIEAVNWYKEHLAVEVGWQNPSAAMLLLSETPLTLLQYRYPGFEAPPDAEFTFSPVTQVVFNLYTPDIVEAHRRLQSAGVQVGEIIDHGSVKEFFFDDLDGNALAVVWWKE